MKDLLGWLAAAGGKIANGNADALNHIIEVMGFRDYPNLVFTHHSGLLDCAFYFPRVKSKRALSHDAVLAGRHVKDISIRVKNKAAKQSLDSLTEKEFYNLLIERYLMTDEQLTRNGYPRAVAGDNQLVSIQQSHFEKTKAQKSWASKDDLERLCSRCHKEFRLDPKGKVVAAECIYHFKGLQRRGELARVSVVDMHNKLVLDLVVKPHNTVIDYNTRFSGLTANQVEASTIDLFEAQNRLFELVNERSILIGHSLESDLKAMRLRHERVVDTAVVFEHRQGFPFKRALRNLASEYLQKIIQEDVCSITFQNSDMAGVVGKVQKLGQTLWEHKKKTACAGVLLVFAGKYAATMHMNRKIRTAYALEAKKFGEETISAEERPRRVLVLANTSSNERASYDDFTKNALPFTFQADSESQLEALAAAVDTQEADAMYIVGGDGTLGTVITGILRNREAPVLPIGMFPGGYDNLSLKRLAPSVFGEFKEELWSLKKDSWSAAKERGRGRDAEDVAQKRALSEGRKGSNESSKDVRRMCESAMALIEENRRSVPAFELTVEGADSVVQPIYSVGDVGAGWFRHIEERRRKLWYFGAAKRRWAYFWEMLKACTGCRTCRPPVVFEPPAWRWWHILTGPPRQPEKEGGFFIIFINPLLFFIHISDFLNEVGTTDNDDFYTTDLLAKAVSLTFVKLPEFIHRLYVSSDHMSENLEGKKIKVKATDRRVEMYLPNALRVDIDSL
ncbi:unnamed protein product [Nippostrongylus brasiliensis]|uniref:AT10584p (inferred by orthology to a D. melanogaster protein) n=1 Tax=Nippostrongylus brasiliensis TaxID=27835 RepID=A0A158QYK8_NIPBR|nr:unnamed protein product [Nippostrongylus brasiliensis]